MPRYANFKSGTLEAIPLALYKIIQQFCSSLVEEAAMLGKQRRFTDKDGLAHLLVLQERRVPSTPPDDQRTTQ